MSLIIRCCESHIVIWAKVQHDQKARPSEKKRKEVSRRSECKGWEKKRMSEIKSWTSWLVPKGDMRTLLASIIINKLIFIFFIFFLFQKSLQYFSIHSQAHKYFHLLLFLLSIAHSLSLSLSHSLILPLFLSLASSSHWN